MLHRKPELPHKSTGGGGLQPDNNADGTSRGESTTNSPEHQSKHLADVASAQLCLEDVSNHHQQLGYAFNEQIYELLD